MSTVHATKQHVGLGSDFALAEAFACLVVLLVDASHGVSRVLRITCWHSACPSANTKPHPCALP